MSTFTPRKVVTKTTLVTTEVMAHLDTVDARFEDVRSIVDTIDTVLNMVGANVTLKVDYDPNMFADRILATRVAAEEESR